MSYELRVWCCVEPPMPQSLPDTAFWKGHENGTLSFETRSWGVECAIAPVEPEDVEPFVGQALPGVAWLMELNLSPISADLLAQRFLHRTARALAKAGHGVIEDPQLGTLAFGSGVKRFATPRKTETSAIVELSWWTQSPTLRDAASLDELFSVLKRSLPEAVPRRYGEYEPLKYKVAREGEAHLRDFFTNSPSMNHTAFLSTRPVLALSLSNTEPPGWDPRGYRANVFEISIEAAALEQPGWQRQLRLAWQQVSRIVRPFYGDVRLLSGYVIERGQYWLRKGSEEHPVVNWWWKGIPPTRSAIAIVLGEPYRSLWSLPGPVVEDHGLLFASVGDWYGDARLSSIIGDAPRELAQPAKLHAVVAFASRIIDRYPKVFPFEKPT